MALILRHLALTEAKSIVETVDIRFVYQCATEIGAPKSWIGDKCLENMVSWMEMDPRIRPLAFLNKTQMREMAEENNFSIPRA